MKIFVIILGVLVTQASNINCFEFFDIMIEKMNEFGRDVTNFFERIGDRVKALLNGNRRLNHDIVIHSEAIPEGYKVVYQTERMSSVPSEQFRNQEPDPPAFLSTPQLAALHGKKVESHVISTSDGYLLTLHRIDVDDCMNETIGTVLLHHGLLGSSADWILLGANKSLPYLLSSMGYDVWMINARGNYYSRGHIEMKVDCEEYWSFSFHEMGIYDIPAALDYIRKVKNSTEEINFIGHSMGAAALLVLLSTQPRYNEYFRIAILLAPMVYMNNIKGPLKSNFTLLKELGERELLPQRKIPHDIARRYCKGLIIFCTNPLFFFSGLPEYTQWTDEFISSLLYHVPAGGSINTIKHYQQMSASGKFHKFGDMFSEYALSEVTVPIAMISSSEDWLATLPDVLKLFYTIRVPIDNFVIHGKKISHTEFVWGATADRLIFPRVFEYLEHGTNYTSFRNEIKLN